MSLFKTKVYSKSKCVKSAYGGGRKQSEDNAIKSIRNRFKLKKENEAIKDRIIRDIRTPFLNKKMIIINQLKYVIFGITIISNMKVVVTETKAISKRILR